MNLSQTHIYQKHFQPLLTNTHAVAIFGVACPYDATDPTEPWPASERLNSHNVFYSAVCLKML